ncbi:MAG TPA: hypothetical protein VFO89_12905 [Thermoanaerobaculia bacterium]|nr:hypothetical protein [Thermoanaerobaculia bacterium]
MRKRGILLLAATAAIGGCVVQLDGALRPAQRAVTVQLPGLTLTTPALYASVDEPDAVYVVSAGPRADGRFDATRVDVRSGAQSAGAIGIGPGSGFTPFIEGAIRTEVKGLSLRRPVFHLMTLPDGRGPGIHLTGSDTGLVRLIHGNGAARRTLAERWVWNSGSTETLRAQATTDATGRHAAVVTRSAAGWTLHLFDISEES